MENSTRIPRSALILGFAGLIPFLWGAISELGLFNVQMGDPSSGNGYPLLVPGDGRLLMIRYGTVILCFMSGVLWGFATKTEGTQATAGYILSVLPALWIFASIGRGPTEALLNLVAGFVAVLFLDYAFWKWGLAPRWWMKLRIPLSVIVTACLLVGAF